MSISALLVLNALVASLTGMINITKLVMTAVLQGIITKRLLGIELLPLKMSANWSYKDVHIHALTASHGFPFGESSIVSVISR